jgi:hypothetical protein
LEVSYGLDWGSVMGWIGVQLWTGIEGDSRRESGVILDWNRGCDEERKLLRLSLRSSSQRHGGTEVMS